MSATVLSDKQILEQMFRAFNERVNCIGFEADGNFEQGFTQRGIEINEQASRNEPEDFYEKWAVPLVAQLAADIGDKPIICAPLKMPKYGAESVTNGKSFMRLWTIGNARVDVLFRHV